MKKIAICGGSGVVGTALAAALKREGHFVVVYDRAYPAGGIENRPAHEYHIFDLVNSPDYYAAFRWQQYDICYQLAAPAKSARDADALREVFLVNFNVLEACRAAGTKTVVFGSHAGDGEYRKETIVASGFSVSKFHGTPLAVAHKLLEDVYQAYARDHDMRTEVVRLKYLPEGDLKTLVRAGLQSLERAG